ncbi:MAG: carotenoid oxygenase family protein [Desertimonas sp.]
MSDPATAAAPSPRWATGAYAPVTEELTARDLTVIGRLPAELDGRYLRNGPNPIGPIDPHTGHWFTGDGMVHGIRLRDGRAEWYRNRWIRSNAVSEALGEPPAPGERHGGLDTANTNVIGLAGRTFALVEAGARPVELTEDLTTVGHSDLGGTLPHGYSAHPKRDPATGDLHAIAYHWAIPHLEYVVVAPDGRVRRVQPIEVEGGPMVHDCSITQRWMVVYDLPVAFDLDVAMNGGFPYTWQPERRARVGLVPLGGGAVRWFDVEPCYVFHPLNAYDDGERVVLEVVRYDRVFDRRRSSPDDTAAHWHRWTIDLAAGRVHEEQRSDVSFEFPRVDERLVGRPNRYGYGTTMSRSGDGNEFSGQLVRIDQSAGRTDIVDLGVGRTSGEWVMIPRHSGAAEDDGWLMGLVYDRDRDRSELVVVDAGAPDGLDPVARVELPARVPIGFHGNWLPS